MQEFENELKKYRFWNRVGIISFISIFPSGIFIFWMSHKIAFFDNMFVVILGLILLFLFSTIKTNFFRCPRCQKYFSIKELISFKKKYYNTGRHCVHCGLSAYTKN
jgi:hypothetical protein